MWLPIVILVLVCAVLGGYVYLAEYRSGALEPAPADRDGDLAPREGHPR